MIRVTVTKPNVFDGFGRLMIPGTIYTVDTDFGLSLLEQGKAFDTDASLGSPGVEFASPSYILFKNAAAIASPTQAMLNDISATYALDVPPYTRYQSNGTALVAIGSGGPVIPSDPGEGDLNTHDFNTRYGGVADGVTDNLAAYNIYLAYVLAEIAAGRQAKGLRFGVGSYMFSGTLIVATQLFGCNSLFFSQVRTPPPDMFYFNGTTRLHFPSLPPNTACVSTPSDWPVRAQGVRIIDLDIVGPGRAVSGSRGIYTRPNQGAAFTAIYGAANGTVGLFLMQNVFVSDVETGVDWVTVSGVGLAADSPVMDRCHISDVVDCINGGQSECRVVNSIFWRWTRYIWNCNGSASAQGMPGLWFIDNEVAPSSASDTNVRGLVFNDVYYFKVSGNQFYLGITDFINLQGSTSFGTITDNSGELYGGAIRVNNPAVDTVHSITISQNAFVGQAGAVTSGVSIIDLRTADPDGHFAVSNNIVWGGPLIHFAIDANKHNSVEENNIFRQFCYGSPASATVQTIESTLQLENCQATMVLENTTTLQPNLPSMTGANAGYLLPIKKRLFNGTSSAFVFASNMSLQFSPTVYTLVVLCNFSAAGAMAVYTELTSGSNPRVAIRKTAANFLEVDVRGSDAGATSTLTGSVVIPLNEIVLLGISYSTTANAFRIAGRGDTYTDDANSAPGLTAVSATAALAGTPNFGGAALGSPNFNGVGYLARKYSGTGGNASAVQFTAIWDAIKQRF